MNGWQISLLITAFVFLDFVVIGAVMHLAGTTLRELSAKFPGVQPLPNAVRKEFQSFRFDLIGLGGSVHVVVDEKHLHLQPAWLARALMRMKPISIPWSAITPAPESSQSRRFSRKYRAKYIAVKIGSMHAVGPAWALALASPDSSSLTDPPRT